MTMNTNIESNDISGFSFQVDLLNLNLHLAEAEQTAEPQTRAHEAAIAQMRMFSSRT